MSSVLAPIAHAPGRVTTALRDLAMRLPHPLYFIAHHLHGRIRWRLRPAAGADGAFRPLSSLDLDRHRKSTTLFVMGSGASINSLTAEQWAEIGSADSLGLSFWPLHEFVPTYLSLEGPRDPDRATALYDLLTARAQDYRDVPLIAKGGAQRFDAERFAPALRPNLYYSAEMIVPARNETEFRRSLRWLMRLRLLDPQRALDEVPMTRASLTYALFIGVAMGYRTIVLCGIDLNTTGYFYEESAPADLEEAGIVPRTGQEGEVHLTFDPSLHPLTIDRVVRTVRREILEPAGVRLFIGSRDSALYPELPYYFERPG